MTDYRKLHLESIQILANYMDAVKEDMWENDDFDAFYLTIQETMDGICFECALLPFEDESDAMKALNAALEAAGYEVNGYGWEEYLDKYIEENVSAIYGKLGFDSEADTCGVYVMDSLEDYRALLKAVSQAVRELADN